MKVAAAIVCVVASTLVGCGNPVQDALIAALPPEVPGVGPGPFHRPGQDCTLCHDDYGGAPPFSVAGTIFAVPADTAKSVPRPVNGAHITLSDTTGVTKHATTNCVGNFFLTPDQYNPQYPMDVTIDATVPGVGEVRQVMETRINREGSCGFCHVTVQSESSPGWIWVTQNTPDPVHPVSLTCPGAPNFQ